MKQISCVIGIGSNCIVKTTNQKGWLLKFSNHVLTNQQRRLVYPVYCKFIEKWKKHILDFNLGKILTKENNLEYQYEYLVSLVIHKYLDYSSIDIYISTPSVRNYGYGANYLKFQFEIQEIQPLNHKDINYLIIIDLINPNTNKFIDKKGYLWGYEILENNKIFQLIPNISDIQHLITQVGILMSYLNFILNIDGYGCKLIIGRKNNVNGVYLLGLGKTLSFDFQDMQQEFYRIFRDTHQKIIGIENLVWSSIKNYITTNNPIYIKFFLKGYKSYLDFKNKEKTQLYNFIYKKLTYLEK